MQFEIDGTHKEAVLNKLTKPELAQLLLNTEADMGAQIYILTTDVQEFDNNLKSWRQIFQSDSEIW